MLPELGPDVRVLCEGDEDDEPLLPGDAEYLALSDEERLALPTVPHEEIRLEFDQLIARYSVGGSR